MFNAKKLAVFSVLALGTTWAMAAPSNFQNTCRNIQLHTSPDGASITAQCKTRDGNYQDAEYEIRGIINDDGRLRGAPGQQTSFQETCRDRKLSWNSQGVKLSAVCRTRDGDERPSTVELLNIQNIDGEIVNQR